MILGIGVASLSVRVLARYDFDRSALVYVGIPYLIALAIMVLRPLQTEKNWWQHYISYSASALTLFLGSSIVLFEGFICVLFFLPIFYLVVSAAFFVHLAVRAARHRRTYAFAAPVLFLFVSVEGIAPAVTFDRNTSVRVSATVAMPGADVAANLAKPFELDKGRHWLLTIFPMPYDIEAGSLRPGDVHHIRTRYHRWFFTNTHEGEMALLIAEVGPGHVRTRVLSDSTFFSTYLELHGTEIRYREIEPGMTEISLRLDYRRNLDPAWYFSPLQRYAMRQMAFFLIREVVVREQQA